MAKYTYINGDLSALADILDESGYFDTVTYSSSTYSITCTINGNTVFWYQGRANYDSSGSASSINTAYNIKVYGVTPSFVSNISSSSNLAWTYFPSKVYECSGGIAIVCSYGRIVITKNQRGETTVIFNTGTSSSSTNEAMATVGAIAYTDRSTFATCKVNTNISSQTLLVQICSCAEFDTESFTEAVQLSAYKQFTTIGFLTYNNKRYFFDGYFAIEDPETSGGGGAS
jgi:hypothetical protein